MSSSPEILESISFGQFEANLRCRELRRDGAKVRLPDQSFQVLALLLERPGELVTREEIHRRLWPADTFVDFDHGLNNAVNRLREALGDSADAPRFIETLPRRGYRFIARLAQPQRDPSVGVAPVVVRQIAEPPPADAPDRGRHTGFSRWLVIAMAGLLVASLAITKYRARRSVPAAPIRSLAVLPLENLSGDPAQDYFADGITDSLITDLARIGSLRVISRTSVMTYKTVRKPLAAIAQELNVDAMSKAR